MGLPGKPDSMTGAEVEKYYYDGHIRQITDYCESDVLNAYRVWLRGFGTNYFAASPLMSSFRPAKLP
jgi:predicted PolB exonuclease-like 3'-5' exonuclease